MPLNVNVPGASSPSTTCPSSSRKSPRRGARVIDQHQVRLALQGAFSARKS